MKKDFFYRFLTRMFCVFPLRRKTILFLSYYGAQYGCNPKYLSEYLVKEHPKWNVCWGFTDTQAHSSVPVRKVQFPSVRFFYELATCQVFVANYRMPEYYKRRKGQLYVQTWHSSLRLKAIEADAQSSLSEHYIQMAKHDSKQISFLLSGCEKSTEIFRRAFWYDGKILPSGTPRMDIFFSENVEAKRRIKQTLGINDHSRVVLYAPTFRENKKQNVFNIDLTELVDGFQRKWGGEWTVLIRLHPHLRNNVGTWAKSSVSVRDVTAYDDIQELLYVSDVVISDYSSLVFDFAQTRRPCFLFTPDLKEYLVKERNLYFNLEDLPFPIIRNNEDLVSIINGFNERDYCLQINSFLKKVGSYETGHACENVYQAILDHLS